MYKHLDKFSLLVFALFAVVLGFWGFSICGADCHAATWTQCIFDTFNLVRGSGHYYPGKDPWQLVIAQFAMPATALWTAARLFLAGLRRDVRVALARRKYNHTIVCGLGDVGMQVIQNLRSSKQNSVAIDVAVDSPHAATCERSGIPVLKGDARNVQVLLAAGIKRANTIVISTGADARNMDIALRVKKLLTLHPSRSRHMHLVFVEMRSDWLFVKLINHDKKSLGSANVDLRLFNTYASAARILIRALRLPPGPEIQAETFIVVGFGPMGQAAVLQIIRACPVGLNGRPRIVVFDQEAEELGAKFVASHPGAEEIGEVEFVAATLNPDSADIKTVVEEKLRSAGPLLGIAVSLGDDDSSLYAALELRNFLDRVGQLRVPIYVQLSQYRQLGNFTGDIESMAHFENRLRVFGTLEEILNMDALLNSRLDTLAQAFHDDYRRRAAGNINPQADVPWHDLPEFMKMSNRWRADHTLLIASLAGFRAKEDMPSVRVLSLTTEEVELLAQLEHRRFSIERRLLDWRAGATQHHIRRKSPNLNDWATLSDSQREWNRAEMSRLPQILAGVGIELCRQRNICAYGSALQLADAEVEHLLADPQPVHCVVVVDLDEPEARRIAERALGLPSVSFWLFSREEPGEFSQRRSRESADDQIHEVIERSEGWLPREQIIMQQKEQPQPAS